jgi:Fe-S cluster assembly protein SufD
VFQGKIAVARDAQKADGHQLSKTLLLSDGAEIDTKPELEIFADDVKCSHGAAAGELDDDALFYLRARGIGLAAARRMLIEAFLDDLLLQVAAQPARAALGRRIADWLAALPATEGA